MAAVMLSRPAFLLGWLGLAPALLSLVAFVGAPGWQALALRVGGLYAGLILSFLGGTWWALATRAETPALPLYALAVVPSLAALALLAAPSPGRIALLGLLIAATLAADRLFVARGLAPAGWMALRIPLSLGLGGLTIALGLLARG